MGDEKGNHKAWSEHRLLLLQAWLISVHLKSPTGNCCRNRRISAKSTFSVVGPLSDRFRAFSWLSFAFSLLAAYLVGEGGKLIYKIALLIWYWACYVWPKWLALYGPAIYYMGLLKNDPRSPSSRVNQGVSTMGANEMRQLTSNSNST